MSRFSIKSTCRDEFRLKNFLFDHPSPRTFTRFQFGFPRVYVGWRVCWALYHIVWIILTGVYSYQWAGPETKQQVKWFIYLTNWAYFVLTMATITDACAVVYIYIRRKDIISGSCNELPWYLKAAWCIVTMASVIGIVMSIAYWGLLPSRERTAVDIATHALNVIYIILNLLVTGMPVRLLHFWYSIVFAATYAIFTLVYYLAGGTSVFENPYVYKVIDWRELGTTIGYCFALGFVLTTLVHAVLYGIHCLKLLVFYKCECCPSSSDSYEGGKRAEVGGETGF